MDYRTPAHAIFRDTHRGSRRNHDTPTDHSLGCWNIPSSVKELHGGLENLDRLEDPLGLRQGPNTASGSVGYKGPRPPQGDPAHRYHFEVVALDQMLALPGGADRGDLMKAMQGHVLAKGELVGLFKRPEHPAKP
jgi:Raf kinase inhibitor-like YbhB/YbcL family protein